MNYHPQLPLWQAIESRLADTSRDRSEAAAAAAHCAHCPQRTAGGCSRHGDLAAMADLIADPARRCDLWRQPQPMPSLPRQAWNLARSIADFVADGLRTVDQDEYRRRLEVCDACEFRRGWRCLKCGCRLALKAKGLAFRCPENKWPI